MRMPFPALAVAMAGLVALFSAPPAPAEYLPRPGAVLQGLDKITARVTELEVANGDVVLYGRLSIRVDACDEHPPEEPPEAAAFLEVTDLSASPPTEIFRGWMFASSPAVSALEHPVYDLRVLRCWAPE